MSKQTSSEFDRFDNVVRKVFSVTREEMQKREKEYQRNREQAKQKRASQERKAK